MSGKRERRDISSSGDMGASPRALSAVNRRMFRPLLLFSLLAFALIRFHSIWAQLQFARFRN